MSGPQNPDLTVFVLAGGKSSRMGIDKAFLKFEDRTLLQRSLELAHTVAREVRIVGQIEKFACHAATVPDVFVNCGPLGGIHAALIQSSTNLNLIMAVDMPFLTSKLLQYLVDRARDSVALVTVPRTEDGWQPLCALYPQSFAQRAEEALKNGNYKIDSLFSDSQVNVVSSQQLAAAGFAAEEFWNLNSPEDLRSPHLPKRNAQG